MIKGVISFALTVLVASPLAAQSPRDAETGTWISRPRPADIDPDRILSAEEKGRVVLNDFARCVVDTKPKIVAQAFLASFDDSEVILQEAASRSCLESGRISMKLPLFRGALFAEVYRRHANGRSEIVNRFPAKPFYPTVPIPESASQRERVNIILLRLAACAYGRHPEAVHAIVAEKTASTAQKFAYQTVIPDLAPCVEKDSKFVMSRSVLEGAFGEFLYRSQMSEASTSMGKTQ